MTSDDISLGSAVAMIGALEKKTISAKELLDIHLDRIDCQNAAVNAVVTIDPENARQRAIASDARRATGALLGKLDGIPMTVKDSLLTAGLRTTSGSELLGDHVPANDAASVSRLKSAGANIIGKTNLPAWAGDIQTHNTLFGVTSNPWSSAHSPGGSSGGSAAALAMGFTALEVGSDIAGSLRIPAHACGIYAHKPTLHVVPEAGHVPPPPGSSASTELAVVGPMARSALDLELLFDVLSDDRADSRPGWRAQIAAPRHNQLQDFRVAIWGDDPHLPTDSETRSMIEEIGTELERAGVKTSYVARPFEDTGRIGAAYLDLVLPYLAEGETADTLTGLLANVSRHSAAESKYVNLLVDVRQMSAARHLAAKAVQAETIGRWRRFFGSFDAVVCPVLPTAIGRHQTGEPSWRRTVRIDDKETAYWDQMLWCGALASFAFLPSTARPVKMSSSGVPIGMQIIGPHMEDRTTLRFAALCDAVLGTFQPPPQLATGRYPAVNSHRG